MRSKSGGNDHFNANLLLNVYMKELWKSVSIWQSYDKNFVSPFFDSRCILWHIFINYIKHKKQY